MGQPQKLHTLSATSDFLSFARSITQTSDVLKKLSNPNSVMDHLKQIHNTLSESSKASALYGSNPEGFSEWLEDFQKSSETQVRAQKDGESQYQAIQHFVQMLESARKPYESLLASLDVFEKHIRPLINRWESNAHLTAVAPSPISDDETFHQDDFFDEIFESERKEESAHTSSQVSVEIETKERGSRELTVETTDKPASKKTVSPSTAFRSLATKAARLEEAIADAYTKTDLLENLALGQIKAYGEPYLLPHELSRTCPGAILAAHEQQRSLDLFTRIGARLLNAPYQRGASDLLLAGFFLAGYHTLEQGGKAAVMNLNPDVDPGQFVHRIDYFTERLGIQLGDLWKEFNCFTNTFRWRYSSPAHRPGKAFLMQLGTDAGVAQVKTTHERCAEWMQEAFRIIGEQIQRQNISKGRAALEEFLKTATTFATAKPSPTVKLETLKFSPDQLKSIGEAEATFGELYKQLNDYFSPGLVADDFGMSKEVFDALGDLTLPFYMLSQLPKLLCNSTERDLETNEILLIWAIQNINLNLGRYLALKSGDGAHLAQLGPNRYNTDIFCSTWKMDAPLSAELRKFMGKWNLGKGSEYQNKYHLVTQEPSPVMVRLIDGSRLQGGGFIQPDASGKIKEISSERILNAQIDDYVQAAMMFRILLRYHLANEENVSIASE